MTATERNRERERITTALRDVGFEAISVTYDGGWLHVHAANGEAVNDLHRRLQVGVAVVQRVTGRGGYLDGLINFSINL